MCLKRCVWAALLVYVAADWVEVSVIKPDVRTEAVRRPSVRVKPVSQGATLVGNSPSSQGVTLVSPPHAPSSHAGYADIAERLPATDHSPTLPPPLKPRSTESPRVASKSHLSRPQPSVLVTSSSSEVLQKEMPTPTQDEPLPEQEREQQQQQQQQQQQHHPTESPLEAFQSVHKILLMEKAATVGNKMEFLQNLQNSMLQQIERSMRGLWGERRQARTGKMGFPSMESALLSLSFLVFAVFLIKLVQQLFQSFGNQNNNTAMIVPPQQGQQPLTVGRRRRSPEDLDTTARILKLMDDFQIKLKKR